MLRLTCNCKQCVVRQLRNYVQHYSAVGLQSLAKSFFELAAQCTSPDSGLCTAVFPAVAIAAVQSALLLH